MHGIGSDRTSPSSSEQDFRSFVDQLPVGVLRLSRDLRQIFMNRRLTEFIGVEPGDGPTERLRGSRLPVETRRQIVGAAHGVLGTGQEREIDFPLETDSGTRAINLRLSPEFGADGTVTHVMGVAFDVTERRLAEENVRLQAITDDLTGLYNRRGFLLLAEREQIALRRSGSSAALFFIDVDGLKRINDEHGHDAGDAVLVAVSELLRISFRNSDILARLGGDEFVVLARNCRNPRDLHERLEGHLAEYNQVAAHPHKLSLSVGTAQLDGSEGHSLESQLARADNRMYRDKRKDGDLPAVVRSATKETA